MGFLIDHVYGSWIVIDSFDRDKCETIIRAYRDAVSNPATCRYICQFLAAFEIPDFG